MAKKINKITLHFTKSDFIETNGQIFNLLLKKLLVLYFFLFLIMYTR